MRLRVALLVLVAACGSDPVPTTDDGGNAMTDDGGSSMTCIDADGDGYGEGLACLAADCDDEDTNNWIACGTCADADSDGYFVDCDAYATIDGPDCDDEDTNNWIACGTCADADSDGYFANCDAYTTIDGPDCADTPIADAACGGLNGNACNPSITTDDCDGADNDCDGLLDEDPSTVWYRDLDGDGRRNAADTTNACTDPDDDALLWVDDQVDTDCDDDDVDNWTSCATCADLDGDDFYADCDAFTVRSGPDCAPDDIQHWSDCGACTDADGDAYGALCDLGTDCDDTSDAHWSDCGLCADLDNDNHGSQCDLGTDCDDDDPLTYAGAWDIPQDGIEQDCGTVAGDPAASEAEGVFVATTGTDDTACGTMLAPCATIVYGIGRANTLGLTTLYIAGGSYTTTVNSPTSFNYMGGFDATDWSRDIAGNETRISNSGSQRLITLRGKSVFQGFTVTGILNAWPIYSDRDAHTTIADCTINGGTTTAGLSPAAVYAYQRGRLDVVRSTISNAERADRATAVVEATGPSVGLFNTNLVAGATVPNSGVRVYAPGVLNIVGSDITAGSQRSILSEGPRLHIERSRVRGSITAYNALTAISSLLELGFWSLNGATIVSSTLSRNDGGTAAGLSAGDLFMSNSIVVGAQGIMLNNGGQATVYSSNIFAPALVQSQSLSLVEFNACAWTECADAADNISVDPGFVDSANGDYTLSSACTACIDTGYDPTADYPLQSSLLDFDDTARPQGGGWDMGCYEYIP